MTTPLIIDVSADNSTVDFTQVAAAGVQHVIIRTSLGFNQADALLTPNAQGAQAAGLAVSFYHLAYTHPTSTISPSDDAARQANYFVTTYTATGASPEMLVVDLETVSSLSQSDYTTWVKTFCDTVKASTGIDVILYSYADFLNTHLEPNHGLTNNLWIANYGNISNPPMPIGFNTWYMWQYSETGTIAEINGHVDCSMFNQNTGA